MNRLLLIIIAGACTTPPDNTSTVEIDTETSMHDSFEEPEYVRWFNESDALIADGFDFPVGRPDARGYYNAQKFGENDHLGDDWNGVGRGNTDLGDTVYAVANGRVSFVQDEGAGWGNVIRIIHRFERPDTEEYVESLYAHLDTMLVNELAWVQRGSPIGTIGTAHGAYLAHLHLELRDSVGMDLGGGYSSETNGYKDPTAFIRQNRP
ncbi:MAG: M23 family metallopeptidase [Flavobacteriales bacterium]|nr:M23 family metallopeptidase [Flavobacteriales bacterium]